MPQVPMRAEGGVNPLRWTWSPPIQPLQPSHSPVMRLPRATGALTGGRLSGGVGRLAGGHE